MSNPHSNGDNFSWYLIFFEMIMDKNIKTSEINRDKNKKVNIRRIKRI